MKINGKEIHLENDTMLDLLLQSQGFDTKKIAVMKNGEIVSKTDYSSESVSNNDTLEIVSFVGGG